MTDLSSNSEGFWGTKAASENTNLWFTIGITSFSPKKKTSRSLSPEAASQRLCAGLQGSHSPQSGVLPQTAQCQCKEHQKVIQKACKAGGWPAAPTPSRHFTPVTIPYSPTSLPIWRSPGPTGFLSWKLPQLAGKELFFFVSASALLY